VVCTGGTTNCNGKCVDVLIDPGNCGSCGDVCQGGFACTQGVCDLVCSGGTSKCSDKCVDVSVDPNNCGNCGTVCPGGNTCQSGVCTLVCSGGTINCGGQCADTSADPSNCGSCGNVCPSGYTCQNGNCTLVCPGGTTNCGGQCVNIQTDSKNCGSCGAQCATGQVCQNGACTSSCNPGLSISPGAVASSSGGGVATYNVGPDRMNDGHLESECGTYKFHWVSAESTPASEWIELDWPSAVTVGRIAIDTTAAAPRSAASTPALARGRHDSVLERLDLGERRQRVRQTDDWSYTLPSPVSTTKLRITACTLRPGLARAPIRDHRVVVFSC
jgi:hypothetical protein